ncbi:G-protein alpha subunit [Schizosaccharomyces osmophilus]|uniref:G-protein alpha subunit n=1 Tax=Schizosaccharomyces osmophilus TaxID=2545709 RepID=A0AAE9WCA2_9SCHI|nr:G-protein alpha subunit [Schizosaccharomyces osmophilus]WBW73732.1 G-protein alpha subunit [Schizosaccharomyces osmophilus]
MGCMSSKYADSTGGDVIKKKQVKLESQGRGTSPEGDRNPVKEHWLNIVLRGKPQNQNAGASNQNGNKNDNEIKVLLLGAGDSGKTTIMKQMRLLYSPGFNQAARRQYRIMIFENIITSVCLLMDAMENSGMSLLPENEKYRPIILRKQTIQVNEPFPADLYEALRALTLDPKIRTAQNCGTNLSLLDNFYYYQDHIDRIFDPQYLPSDQDILHCRIKTTGISEETFLLNRHKYRFFDVGGQRSERRKWIHCFESVTALLFLVSLAGYDQCLVEDNSGNQMQEALLLWDSICNSSWFAESAMILFLNKLDLFKRKVHISPIQQYFPDYQETPSTPTFVQTQCPFSDNAVKSGMYYFYLKFESLNRIASRSCYCHFTTATDTSLLQRVMVSVQDTIMSNNLQSLMF